VTFHDKSKCKALLVRFDEDKDIAVLHVPKKNLRPLSHGDSSKLQHGDKVTAISNLYGMYPSSCTDGIISFVGRDVDVEPIGQKSQKFIQTNAASTKGSSGGALVNQFGELIGMITRVQKTFSDASGGVAFAIPLDRVVDVVHQLLSNDGKVERPFLGILYGGRELRVKMEKLGMKGVAFKDAPKEGPAGRKKLVPTSYIRGGKELKLGDIITSVNGKEVTNGLDLIRILENCKIDEEVTLEMTSGSSKKRKRRPNKKTVHVKLESKSKLEETAGRKWGANYI
ncbi:hypothetical protein SLEP1_g59903, partial [Rubroshorea leprosula]